MSNKFDELAKGLAQSVTRRQAFKKFGVGLAAMAVACFGLANRAHSRNCDPPSWCNPAINPCCCRGGTKNCNTGLPKCNPTYGYCANLCAGMGLFCP
jgi:hypothetical protein